MLTEYLQEGKKRTKSGWAISPKSPGPFHIPIILQVVRNLVNSLVVPDPRPTHASLGGHVVEDGPVIVW